MVTMFVWTGLFIIPALVSCVDPEIPGPHFPIAGGAPGDEIVNTGIVPKTKFLSYRATDANNNERVYVPVYVAVLTDAGETNHKDVRQNFDKSITIQGSPFWCAFGHPYRQFAFQDKYKYDILTEKKIDPKVPRKPLIRSFLVESHVVSDIMLKATTEHFNKIGGTHDMNVDKAATNQFGIASESRSKLEMAALPGSLITYVEKYKKNELEKEYPEVTKSWGQIKDVADLKQKFDVTTEVFASIESSMFLKWTKKKKKKKKRLKRKITLADYEYVRNNKDPEWKKYAGYLKEMEGVSIPQNPHDPNMQEIPTSQISEYPVTDFTDENNVKNLITKQTYNSQHAENFKRLADSLETVKVATPKEKSWIHQFVNFIEGDPNGKDLKKQKKKKFSPSFDDFKDYLKKFDDFPFGSNGEDFTKANVLEYYRNRLTAYIKSDECKLTNENKNIIVQNLIVDENGEQTPLKRTVSFTNDENSGTKIVLRDGEPKHVIMPGDQLSIEFVGNDIDLPEVKNALSQMYESTSSISLSKKLILDFPDADLSTDTELKSLWKKLAVGVGDYLRDTRKAQNIELTFKNSESIKYDMISHTMDDGKIKEWPLTFANGHPVIDKHIAPVATVRMLKKTYDDLVNDDGAFRKLQEKGISDTVFVPNEKGVFLTNTNHENVLKSVSVDDYKTKQFIKAIRNEIIIELKQPDAATTIDSQNQEHVRSAPKEASEMLASGYRKKQKDNIIIVEASKDGASATKDGASATKDGASATKDGASATKDGASATKDGNKWRIKLKSPNSPDIGVLDNVRITIVGLGEISPEKGKKFIIGGHDSKEITALLKETKQKLDIKDHALKKVSVVACNPEDEIGTKSEKRAIQLAESEKRAIQLAQDVAKQNKVSVSTRVGYVKVDKEGHKWYSATADGDYHRRKPGDVYIALWDDAMKTVRPVVEKIKEVNILQDPDVPNSGHLGSKTVLNEAESEIFKNGWFLKQEIERNFDTNNIDKENNPAKGKNMFDNPKVQKRLQRIGNVMSAYGVLQTASFLINAEKCEKTNYSSTEACEARKHIAIISVTQEALEIAETSFKAIRRALKTTPQALKAGTTGLKAFGKSVLRNPIKGLPLLGVGLDIASLGLDIYDLTRAKTATEKGISGTNVALSGISLIAGTAAFVAGIMGATTVAGPAALIVGLVAFAFNIGVTIWQTIEYEKMQTPLVNQAAKAFEEMYSLYNQPWYECKKSALYVKPGIAVKSVNLIYNYIEANSDYLCETRRKNYKTHVRIFPLLVGSEICDDYSSLESNCYCQNLQCPGLINVRSGMNIGMRQNFHCSNVKTIILNTAPIVLYDYSYAYFDTHDPVIGLFHRLPENRYSDKGHNLARRIDYKNANFFYSYKFCWAKYAIINRIVFKRNIPSDTEVKLDSDHVQVVIPELNDILPVTFALIGIPGTAYSVYVSNSCKVKLSSKPETGHTVWKLFIDTELADISCTYKSTYKLYIEYESTEINVDNTSTNQILFVDKYNILSVPLLLEDKAMIYIVDIQASKFVSDKAFLGVIERYLRRDFIDLSMTYTPVKNLRIQACGHRVIPKAFVSMQNYYARLHFTTEYPGSCSSVLNTDAELHLEKDGNAFYSSSSYSLAWRTHVRNNSLISLMVLPCHSELRSDVFYSDIEENFYITQIVNLTHNIEIHIKYKMTDSRLYMLSILSELYVPWETLKTVCFNSRKQIFSVQQQLEINSNVMLAGENDVTFVNTSNELYWVKKRNKNVVGRIVPNLNTKCDAINISFQETVEKVTSQNTRTNTKNNDNLNSTELYYFLCVKNSNSQIFVQLGNNEAKRVENLDYQQVYFDGNDIFVKNKTNVFSFDDKSPSKVCLYEYEMVLPYEHVKSVDEFMVGISQENECIESKLKLRFKELVGWFDFEEMVTTIVHKSISTYKLKPVGPNTKLDMYWIWDTVNGTLYQQETTDSSELLKLIIGNTTEEEYQTMIAIPEKVITDVQEVNYESGKMYVYTTDGATYSINENGGREMLAVTDFWLTSHPEAESELQRQTNKEIVMYRPDLLNTPSNSSCNRSTSSPRQHADNFLLYHVQFGLVFDVHLDTSVYIGSSYNNMSIFIFNYQTKTLLELDKYGTVLGEDHYDLVHRINDRTLIIESSTYTESQVPPIVDGIETIILGASETKFIFNLTEWFWSNINEVLISSSNHVLSVNLDMMPCDYALEWVDDRAILIDYAYRKKLIITNAEERSKDNLLSFYVCGKRIQLHNTNNYLIYIIPSISAALLIGSIVIGIVVKRRRQVNVKDTKGKDGMFVPNEKELQHFLDSPVQAEHRRVAVRKAILIKELKKEKTITQHRIMTKGETDTFV